MGNLQWGAGLDRLHAYLPKSKADQKQERVNSREPKHVYANPLNPAICPILSLAVLLNSKPGAGLLNDNQKVFGGGIDDKGSRAGRALSKLKKIQAVRDECAAIGVRVDDITLYSLRYEAGTL